MTTRKKPPTRWAVKWRSRDESRIMWRACLPLLFQTRAHARAWIEKNYGYIRTRKDLHGAPHYWNLPIAVLVAVTLKEIDAPKARKRWPQKRSACQRVGVSAEIGTTTTA